MTARPLPGAPAAGALLAETAARAARLPTPPHLVMVRLGEDPASVSYVRGKDRLHLMTKVLGSVPPMVVPKPPFHETPPSPVTTPERIEWLPPVAYFHVAPFATLMVPECGPAVLIVALHAASAMIAKFRMVGTLVTQNDPPVMVTSCLPVPSAMAWVA